VGHAYRAERFMRAHPDTLEAERWLAMRGLEASAARNRCRAEWARPEQQLLTPGVLC
jgi:hypothetical protein